LWCAKTLPTSRAVTQRQRRLPLTRSVDGAAQGRRTSASATSTRDRLHAWRQRAATDAPYRFGVGILIEDDPSAAGAASLQRAFH